MAAMHVGPRSLDPMAGYRPDWQPGPAMPRSAGIGPWRPALVVLASFLLVVNFLGGSGVPEARADAWSESDVACTTNRVVLTTVQAAGNTYVAINYHLVIEAGGTVQGAWIASGGYIGTYVGRSGGLDGAGQWWITNQGVTVEGTASGTLQYVVQKAASYGGCFSVDHITVMTVPTVGPGPSWTPSFAAPSSTTTPVPTVPSGYTGTCTQDPNDPYGVICDPPPDGFCWTGSFMGGLGPRLEYCEEPSPAPTPTPMAGEFDGAPSGCSSLVTKSTSVGPWTYTRGGSYGSSYIYNGGTFGGNQSMDDPTFVTLDAEHPLVCMKFTVTARSGFDGSHYARALIHGALIYAATAVEDGTGERWLSLEWNGGSAKLEAAKLDAYQGSITVSQVDTYYNGGLNGGVPVPTPGPTPSYDPYPMPSGWPSYPPLPTFGAMPSFAWPTYPPFAWPSYPPFPSGKVDICAPASPGGPSPNIEACRSVAPSQSFTYGVPDPSGALTGFEALASNAAGRIPFGIVTQVGDALGGAANDPGGPALDWCADIPVPVIGNTVETCVPTDTFEALTPWRPLLVGIVWLGTALALFRVARGSVGQTDATG